jgi:phospholipid/cholesterol/gamma-HCH transport system ATP-binding protein
MAEEKDADELAQEEAEGHELPPLPPIPLQLLTSDNQARPTQREPGAWCRDNGVTPPPGSFESQNAAAPAAPKAAEPQPTTGGAGPHTGEHQPVDGHTVDEPPYQAERAV